MKFTFIVLVGVLTVAIIFGVVSSLNRNRLSLSEPPESIELTPKTSVSPAPDPSPIGPRMNLPQAAPQAYGFWSFSILEGGKVSRSGQPTLAEFKWLKDNGWRGIVNLRISDEYGETGDDAKIPGFNELGFNYLHLPIPDGGAPTGKQAETFLKFVTDPANQPVEVHCRGGYGRTGTMIALYRYEVDGWPILEAIDESRLYHGGISSAQERWLLCWAVDHPRQGL